MDNFLYIASVVGANIVVGLFGKGASILTPLLFLAVTMLTRDILHQHRSKLYMFGLIGIGSIISYLCNTSFIPIAIASCIAFSISEGVDYIIYSNIQGNWYYKAISSSVAAVVIDSILFVTIAFGFDIVIIVGQIITKSIGIVWTILIYRLYVSSKELSNDSSRG